MQRRGQTEDALGHATGVALTLNMPIASILHNPAKDWSRISSYGSSIRTARGISVDWRRYKQDDFLFTHATICCSVETEADGHTIKPSCSELVNDNGNAWTNPVLLATFRSFVGAENYLEHCFPAGTRVNMADGTLKNIEDIWSGENVIDRNGKSQKVLNTQIRFSNELYTIKSEGLACGFVKVTGSHPFWVHSSAGFEWKKAAELVPGIDKIAVPAGMSFAGTVSIHGSPWRAMEFTMTKETLAGDKIRVYNIEVEDDHSYCVENAVVHNCQIPELSKGKIIDAVIRPVKHISKSGEIANIYYVDILVATNRRHTRLIRDIEDGTLTTLSMGCGIAGTPVVMADGSTKPVDKIVVGDEVITHTGGIAKVESTRVRQTTPGELRRLSIDGIPDTFVTEEHPYWILQGYDVCKGCGSPMEKNSLTPWCLDQIMHPWCSSSCKQKHFNSNPKGRREFKPFEQKPKFDWIRVGDLKKGDYVAIPLGRPSGARKHLEQTKAKLLGYYAAEGNLQRADNGRVRAVEFSLHETEPAGDDIISLAKQWGIEDSRIYSQIRVRSSGRSRRIVIHDESMAKWLLDSCGEHSDAKKFAPWVVGLDDESLLDVVGAYINGDGTCRPNASMATVSASRALSEQILTMLLSLGIPASISESRQKNRKPVWRVYCRKGHCGVLEGKTFKYASQQVSKFKVSNVGGYMLKKVTGNEPVDLVTNVYNIHVQNDSKDHSYIMNGIAVHNCEANNVTCSRCGQVFGDGQKSCTHIEKGLLDKYIDNNGIERITSELCGYSIFDGKLGIWVGVEGSVKFIEASWVENPAFKGAVINHYVSELNDDMKKILSFSTEKLQECMNDILKLRVADRTGMMVLRVAQHEIYKRRREEMINRVAVSMNIPRK
jgi:intein/homing endonuclease